ncbi:MAG: hypothetical protein RLZZ174_326 [Pseudomonadota bacterium]
MEAGRQDWRRLALALVLALGCHGALVLPLPPPLAATVAAPPPATRIPLQLRRASVPTPSLTAPRETSAAQRTGPAASAAPKVVSPTPTPATAPSPAAVPAPASQEATPLALDAFLAAARRYSEDPERPRRLGPGSVLTATEDAYLRGWRERIERLGTLNFPPAARTAAVGEVKLRLRAVLARDGRLEALSVVIGSGYPAVDAAALAIVRQAHPYLPFPHALGAQDRLEVVRDFTFRTR